jgi:hypothetical protein
MRSFIFLFSLVFIVGAGCANPDEKLAQKASIEGRVAATRQLEVETSNLALRSGQMEADLRARHRFYEAVKGTYEGKVQVGATDYKIRITALPSLPPYEASRVRMLDELVYDFNNLYLNFLIVQWNPANPTAAVGCRVEHVRPDLSNGEVNIAADSCPNLYRIWISDTSQINDTSDGTSYLSLSQNLSHRLLDGTMAKVPALRGEVHHSVSALVYPFSATRTQSR